LPPPQDTDSLRELTRELSRLVGRERTQRFIEGVIEEAALDLSPAEGWVLGRAQDGTVGADALEARDPADRLTLEQALGQLRTRGLVESPDAPAPLSAAGVETRRDLMSARQRSLKSLVSDWEPEDPKLDAVIAQLSEELGQRPQG
jgi:hypothetical protein